MLSSMDDYPLHQIAEAIRYVGTSDRNFYDRYYFNLHGSSDELFMVMGLGPVPEPRRAGRLRVRDARGHAPRRARVARARRSHGHDRRAVPRRGDRGPEARALHPRAERAQPRLRPHVGRARSRRSSSRGSTSASTAACSSTPCASRRPAAGRARSRSATRRFAVTPDRWWGTRDRSWGVRPVGEQEHPGIRQGEGQLTGMWNYSPMQFPTTRSSTS